MREKALTEERIINGTTLLKKNVSEYNKLLEFANRLKDEFSNLYTKAKFKMPSRNIPVVDDDIQILKKIGKFEAKNFFEDIGKVGESELSVEAMHEAINPGYKRTQKTEN